MPFWAAFLKTRPKKTQPDRPAFCSVLLSMTYYIIFILKKRIILKNLNHVLHNILVCISRWTSKSLSWDDPNRSIQDQNLK